jgi:serine/threonine protein kinase/tetratricopeptide (TPR) repeat protein
MPADLLSLQASSRYLIERELGQGGMGVVYEARDLETDTRVALKALHRSDALNIYRLKNEFRQLADISHPNLVTLHELCFDGGRWFFTMELVHGTTLDAYVAAGQVISVAPRAPNAPSAPTDLKPPVTRDSRGREIRHRPITLNQRALASDFPLPRVTCHLPRLRAAMRQLAQAVSALHDAGKLHRDIKPSNVLVTAEGRVVVLDFGLVSNTVEERRDAEHTIGGHVFGTPAYMSPEQANGEEVSEASDWYSVGAVLYEALTGQLPFDGSVLQILRQKDELEPLPPGELVEGVPDDLDALCVALLHRDPVRRPGREQILRALEGLSIPPPAGDTPSMAPITGDLRRSGGPFVGRESQLGVLRDAFARAKAGRGAVVFVHGHSGMGKSALVRNFANELIKNDAAVVLRGRCYERESVPYKAFDDVVDALARYLMRRPHDECAALLPRNIHALAKLFPVLTRVQSIANAPLPRLLTEDPREQREQAFTALKDLLLRLSDYRPLVINIDDLQWGDADSARLLSQVVLGSDVPPILFVGSYRREEATTSPFLRHVLDDKLLASTAASVEQLAVDSLSTDDAERLMQALLQGSPAADALLVKSLAAESEGVPFFIGELAEHLKAQARAPLPSSSAVTLETVIAARVAALPKDARRVLELLSIAARPLEQGVALEAAGLPPGDRAALTTLRALRLVRTRGTRQTDHAETYHDRVRETVAAQLSEERVRVLHTGIVRASERLGVGEPEHLVLHYAEAGEGTRAGETALHAAHAAADKLAFDRAAELYRSALSLGAATSPEQRTEIQRLLGDALVNAGRSAQAAEAYAEAALGAEPALGRQLRRSAAQQFLRSGRVEQAIGVTRELFREVGLPYPPSEGRALASIAWNKGRLALRGLGFELRAPEDIPAEALERVDTLGTVFRELSPIDPMRGTAFQLQYLLHALDCGEPHRIQQGLAWEAFNTAMLGGPRVEARVGKVLECAESLARRVGTPYALATWQMTSGGCAFFFGHYEQALVPMISARETLREACPGTSWEQNLLTTFVLGALEQVGSLETIAREAPGIMRQARERDDEFARGFLILSAVVAHLMADDPAAAERVLVEQRNRLGPGFTTLHLWVENRTVDTLLYQGRGGEAHDHYERIWPVLSRSNLYRTKMFSMMGNWFRARSALSAGKERGEAALEVAARAATALERCGRKDAASLALIVRCGLAAARGRIPQALELANAAMAACAANQMPLFALYAEHNRDRLFGADPDTTSGPLARLQAQGVRDPERWAATYAPCHFVP